MDKAIGIIRRMDDLGRIVIPREMRQRLNWKGDDPLEIVATDDGSVFLHKYVPADREGLLQITGQVEDLLKRSPVSDAARSYLEQAFTELKSAVEATLNTQEDDEMEAQK